MKYVIYVAIALVAGGVGLAVGPRIAGEKEIGSEPPSFLIAENQRLESEVESLTETLRLSEEALEQKQAAEETATAKLPGAPERYIPSADDPEATPSLEEPAPTAYFVEEYGGALKDVDFKTIGANLSEMTPLILDIVRSIHDRTPASPEAVGRIQQLNGPLITAALKLDQAVPGIGVNGKFTDPSFMTNAMISALKAAKVPLDEEQTRSLIATARRYMDEDARRRAGYDEFTFTIRKLYEEAELKDRFFEDALSLFTPEQRAAVAPVQPFP